MPKSLEDLNRMLLQGTLLVLHLITYGFIIWTVLCHHGIIDCASHAPAACACHAAAAHAAPKSKPKPKHSPAKKKRGNRKQQPPGDHHRTPTVAKLR
jgi:hypothetical protein